jgi:predicted RNA binding protein with dsRBD fold (UPF0201 family)
MIQTKKLIYDKKRISMNNFLNGVLIVLWSFAIILLGTIICIMIHKPNEAISLLAPLGIIISATLASASVMKSIDNAKRLKITEDQEKIKNAIKYLNEIIQNIQTEIDIFYQYFDMQEGLNTYRKEEIKESIENTKDIQQFIITYQQSEHNNNFLKQLKTTINSLQNLNRMLEDKDIVYYTNINLFSTIKAIQLIISSIEGVIHKNDLVPDNIDNEDAEIKLQHYIYTAIGLREYFNILSSNIQHQKS